MTPDELLRFVGRKNTFAMQLQDGAYVPIRRPITTEDLVKHLKGEHTLGSYVVREDNKITFAVIDIDFGSDETSLNLSDTLAKTIMRMFGEFERYHEFSGRRGDHVWLFFDQPENPKFIRELIKSRFKTLGGGLRNIEIYPKQDKTDELKKQLGNLVKLPCGLHRRSGKYSAIKSHKLKGEL